MTATLIPPQYTMPYGVAEVHAVLFQHRNDRGGTANTVAVMIPEAESSFSRLSAMSRRLFASARVSAMICLCVSSSSTWAGVRDDGSSTCPSGRPGGVIGTPGALHDTSRKTVPRMLARLPSTNDPIAMSRAGCYTIVARSLRQVLPTERSGGNQHLTRPPGLADRPRHRRPRRP